MYFNSAEELIDAFNVRSDQVYERITPLSDRKAGFSIQRRYPEDIRYRPPKLKNGTDDTVALIHVVYEHPEEDKKSKEHVSKVPLVITIVPFSRFRETHYDYNFSDDNCPTKESVEKSKLTPAPIALDYKNAFYYDHIDKRFYDDTGKTFTGLEVLEKVYSDHCDTVHLLKGLKLRFKLRSQSFGIFILDCLVKLLTKTLSLVFGRTLDDSHSISVFFSGYKRENLKKLNTESLSIFGYSTARRVIVLFCLLTIFVFSYYFFSSEKNKYLKTVFSNGFLSLAFSIVIIWILDVVVPVMLFHLINILIKIRTSLRFKNFKAV
jgi:hypothetical protein